jgi:hypothetical protein
MSGWQRTLLEAALIASLGGIGLATADTINDTFDDVPAPGLTGYSGPSAAVQVSRPSDVSLILAFSSVPNNGSYRTPASDDDTTDISSDPLGTDLLPLSGPIFLDR